MYLIGQIGNSIYNLSEDDILLSVNDGIFIFHF